MSGAGLASKTIDNYIIVHHIIFNLGGNMKVTPLMASRWVKAVFLIIIGIVILFYTNSFVEDMKELVLNSDLQVTFEGTWDLLTLLLWILVAWLFADAALTIALSFSEHKYTLLDVVKRLDKIEKKLGMAEPVEKIEEHEKVEEAKPEEPVEEDVPPPPKE